MKIKICGMRDSDNVKEIESLHPYYMGFIFYPPSPRHCGDIRPGTVEEIGAHSIPVAVTVNASPAEILDLHARYGFNTFQLHGDESPEQCRSIRDRGWAVFKAVGVRDAGSLRDLSRYEGVVDMFVFDTSSASRGGTGRKFDWNLLDEYTGSVPFLLSGGVSPDDVESILRITHPRFAGVDLNSRFETAPGVKDKELLEKFIKRLMQ